MALSFLNLGGEISTVVPCCTHNNHPNYRPSLQTLKSHPFTDDSPMIFPFISPILHWQKCLIFHGEPAAISRNIHARVFKSSSRKLAIVAFRGTQFESAKNWHVDADIQRIPMNLGWKTMGRLVLLLYPLVICYIAMESMAYR